MGRAPAARAHRVNFPTAPAVSLTRSLDRGARDAPPDPPTEGSRRRSDRPCTRSFGV